MQTMLQQQHRHHAMQLVLGGRAMGFAWQVSLVMGIAWAPICAWEATPTVPTTQTSNTAHHMGSYSNTHA